MQQTFKLTDKGRALIAYALRHLSCQLEDADLEKFAIVFETAQEITFKEPK